MSAQTHRPAVAAPEASGPTVDEPAPALDEGMGNSFLASQLHSGASGDPADTTAGEGDDAYAVTTGELAMHEGKGGPADRPEPEAREEAMKVDVHATDGSPVHIEGASPPSESQLFSRVEEGGEDVTHVVGTLQDPSWFPMAEEDAIYIAGQPWVDDVIQGTIGDCYMLAVLQSVAASSPGSIQDIIAHNGTSVTITFHKYEGGTWVDAPITTDLSTIVGSDDEGNVFAHGSAFRVAEQPSSANWYATVGGGYLTISQDAAYEQALWVPVLEKAYADFAQQHGQYGGYGDSDRQANANVDEDGNAVSGIDVIEGGWEDLFYGVLFGTALQQGGEEYMEMGSGNRVPAANLFVIENLLQLSGQGLEDGQFAMMQVGAGFFDNAERLIELLPPVRAAADARVGQVGSSFATPIIGLFTGAYDAYQAYSEGSGHLWWHLDSLEEKLEAYLEAEEDDQDALMEEISGICQTLIDPETVPLLHADDAPAEYVRFLELAAQASTAGSDSSNGQRFVYTGHAYSVLGSTLRDSDSNALALSLDTLAAQYTQVDTTTSTVQLRNPHATNEIDLDGAGPTDGVDDGNFEMTLDQFMRGFAWVKVGVVEEG